MRLEGIMESCLYAEDLTAIEPFYSEVPGLELIAREAGRHLFFRCGSAVVLLFNPTRTSAEQTQVGGSDIPLHGSRGAGHLAFRVEACDLPNWKRRLEEAAVEIESEVMWPQAGQSLYFRDPAGNSLELVTPGTWGLE